MQVCSCKFHYHKSATALNSSFRGAKITCLFVKFANNPESDIKAVGIPPDTLRDLWIGPKPCFRPGIVACCAPEQSGTVQEAASSYNMFLPALRSFRIPYQAFRVLAVGISLIPVGTELCNVPEHVLQAEWIWPDKIGRLSLRGTILLINDIGIDKRGIVF